MKIKKLLSITRLLFVLFFSSFLLFNCETDDTLFEETTLFTEQSKRQTRVITFDKLPVQFTKPVNDLEQTIKSSSKTINDDLIIDYSQIVEVVDSLSNTKYSIKFSIPDQPENVLYNLIFGLDASDHETTPFVLKYTINNPEVVYATPKPDFSKMIGTVAQYRLESFLNSIENRTLEESDCPPNDVGDDPEEGESEDGSSGSQNGGGGSNGNPSDQNSNDPSGGDSNGDPTGGGGEIENPDDPVTCNVNVWSTDEGGEYGISWSCSDGSSGWGDIGNRTSETNDCPANGDVGINDSWPYTDCASFEYANRDGIKGAHTIGVNETFVSTVLTSPYTSELNIKNILFPSLFFTMPAHWTNGRAATVTARAVDESIDATKNWFLENPEATSYELKNAWLNFMRSELNSEGGNVYITLLFYVRTPAPYSTSWFLSDCG